MAFWAHAFKFTATVFSFCALVLQLFTLLGNTYNVKFLNLLYFARVTRASDQGFINFGLWNSCYGANNTVLHCSSPKPAFDWTSAEGLNEYIPSGLDSASYSKVFLANFILYWCGFALTLIVFILSVSTHFSRLSDTFAGICTFIAFIVLLVVFCIMVVVSYRVIHTALSTSIISGTVGASTWMTLGAMASLLIATIYYFLGCCFRVKKEAKYDEVY